MAKGGKRTYARDGKGRFASTPGSAAKSTSGRKSTLGARTGLKTSRAKLKAKNKADQTLQNTLSTRAQKGAVKRGSRKLAAAKVAAQTRISGGRKGVIGMPKGLKNRELAGRIDGPVKTANSKPKRSLAVRVAKADKADRKLVAQLKQAKASGNEKKIIDLNFKRRRIDRFNETYNLADLKASRKALTPATPTRTKGSRTALPRTRGTISKPKGLKRDPDAMSTLKSNQKRKARMAQNMRGSNAEPSRIFGYKWEQIQAAQRGNSRALRRYIP